MTEEIPTNSILAVKLDYIQRDISIINKNIADIKADNVTRREFETYSKDAEVRLGVVSDKVKFTSNIVYSTIGLICTAFLVGVLTLVIK